MIRLFISHSSRDEELAGLLVELFRAAFDLPHGEIRCTSVDGYRLPIGADTEHQLKKEILAAPAFLGLLSKAALGSSYVLFELGARWGSALHIAPLLASGVDHRLLPAPIAGKNALRASRAEDLQQMVSDIARTLKLEIKGSALLQKYIQAIVRHQEESPDPSAQEAELASQGSTVEETMSPPTVDAAMLLRSRGLVETREAAEEKIERGCSARWPDDFRMRKHCIEQQRTAYGALHREAPEDLPIDVFLQIRRMCLTRWPEDFRMRLHCEDQQIQSWRDLQDDGKSRGDA